MSFEDAVATQPAWVRYWVAWMGIAIIGTMIALLFSKATRRDSAVILVTTAVIYFAMMWLYQQIGFVRLLGIVHVVVWTPLAVYLWQRLKNPEIIAPFRHVIIVFLVTIVLSLAFDYVDVARYMLGERGSMAQ
ncbi:MAG: hypothetical protein JXQ99_07995 [Hyphomicrobiaceae bacterium]